MKRQKLSTIDVEVGRKILEEAHVPQKTLAFFSSVLGGLTTEKSLMTVPIDDHMVHRGHSVFDTCSVQDGKAYGLDFHIDRFLDSAKKCRIVPYADKLTLKDIILQTLALSQRRDGIYCRFWMSAGRGDYFVSPKNCTGTTFYCAVHEYSPNRSQSGIHERTVSVPVKNVMLATIKTTNYLINALAAMEGHDKGGTLGLQSDEAGNIAECSVGSVGFVFKDQILRTPKLDKILRSTTLIRASELWKDGGVPLKDFLFTDVARSSISDAVEIIGFGGGKVTSIVNLDGVAVGDGKPGPVFLKLRDLLERDAIAGDFVDAIPYDG